MIQCEHNLNGEFVKEGTQDEPGERCSYPAGIVVHWIHPDQPDQPNIEYRCIEQSEHVLLLMDELDADNVDFQVYQLVDVTEAAREGEPVLISVVPRAPGKRITQLTWDSDHDLYGQASEH